MPEIVPVGYRGSYWKHWKTETEPQFFSQIWINSSNLIHSPARRVSWFMSIFSFGLEFSFSFLFSSLAIFIVLILFSFFYILLVLVLVLVNELVFFFVLVFVLVHENNTDINNICLLKQTQWLQTRYIQFFSRAISTKYYRSLQVILIVISLIY